MHKLQNIYSKKRREKEKEAPTASLAIDQKH